MGLFSFFSKKETALQVKVKDIIWMHIEGKKQGCVKLLEQQPNTVLIAWFTETQQQWQTFMQQQHMPQTVLLARGLNALQLAGKHIIMLERYPLPEKEATFFQSLNQLEVVVVSAMDEPLFTAFGSDRIIALLQKLGLKDDEPIEHNMITNSLKNAQSNLEEKLKGGIEQSATSMQDWFSKNIG